MRGQPLTSSFTDINHTYNKVGGKQMTPEQAALLVQARPVLVCLWLSLAIFVAIDSIRNPIRLRRKIIASVIAEILVGIQVVIEVITGAKGIIVSIFILLCMIVYTILIARKRRKRWQNYYNSDRVL